MTRERWGASKFVKNQLRVVADNAYDPEAMPPITADLSEPGSRAFISKQQFTEMCKPAFGNKSMPNINALYKRAHFIINTPDYIVLKQAKSDSVEVFRNPGSYLTTSAGALYDENKENGTRPTSEDHREDIAWEQDWVQRMMSVADRPAPAVNAPPARRRRWVRQALALPES